MIDSFETVVTIAGVIVTTIVVQLANVWFNNRKIKLNSAEVASAASTATVNDMRQLIEELKAELDRREIVHQRELKKREETISKLSLKVDQLQDQIRKMRKDMRHDTKEIIKEVRK